ncbi:hypothetical protein ABBQ32_004252 [Trebouxia sp. C0010 RCD-2024]
MPQQSPNGNHRVTLANRTVVKTEQANISTAANGRKVVTLVQASGYRTGRYREHTSAPKHSYRNRCGDRKKTLQEKNFAVNTKNLIKVDMLLGQEFASRAYKALENRGGGPEFVQESPAIPPGSDYRMSLELHSNLLASCDEFFCRGIHPAGGLQQCIDRVQCKQ